MLERLSAIQYNNPEARAVSSPLVVFEAFISSVGALDCLILYRCTPLNPSLDDQSSTFALHLIIKFVFGDAETEKSCHFEEAIL